MDFMPYHMQWESELISVLLFTFYSYTLPLWYLSWNWTLHCGLNIGPLTRLPCACCCSASQPSSSSAFQPHSEPKVGGRANMPRCRNSFATTADEQPHIGNYRLLKTIGKGNFAKVKLARHVLTGKEVNMRACREMCRMQMCVCVCLPPRSLLQNSLSVQNRLTQFCTFRNFTETLRNLIILWSSNRLCFISINDPICCNNNLIVFVAHEEEVLLPKC